MNNNQNINKSENSNQSEVSLENMNMDQLIYLDKLLRENAELKQRYNQEVFLSNKNKSPIEVYGQVFASVTEASKRLGINRALFYYRMKNKPEFDAFFVELNARGEVISRSKTPPNQKSKQKEQDQK